MEIKYILDQSVQIKITRQDILTPSLRNFHKMKFMNCVFLISA